MPVGQSKTQLRILVHHRVASRDGQAVHLDELIKALVECGHEVKLVGPSRFGGASFGSSNGFVDQLKKRMPRQLYQLLELCYNLIAFFRLVNEVRSFKPTIIYERFSLYLLAGVAVARLTKLPLLLEINSPLFEERLSNGDMGFESIGRECQRVIWKHADRLLPVTAVLAEIIKTYVARPADHIHVIPNGVSIDTAKSQIEAVSVRQKLNLSERLVIGFVGFVRSWNAVDRLLTFLQRNGSLYNLHLLIVGDGPARQSLEQLASEKGISSRVTITGLISREDVGSYIQVFDIAVIPGVTTYSSPLKMFEYMQFSRPIVAPSTPNIREILESDSNALLFNPEINSAEFDEALLRLCESRDLRNLLGSRAKKTIQQRKLTWADNAERVADISNTLL